MKLSQFKFRLPDEQLALYPIQRRHEAEERRAALLAQEAQDADATGEDDNTDDGKINATEEVATAFSAADEALQKGDEAFAGDDDVPDPDDVPDDDFEDDDTDDDDPDADADGSDDDDSDDEPSLDRSARFKPIIEEADDEPFDITKFKRIPNRDECRLMVIHKASERIEMFKTDADGNEVKDEDGKPVYLQFKDIINYFDEGDTMIFNDTKVFPARLYGTKEKTDAKIEVFLLRELNKEMRLWDVLVEPARKIRIGNKLFFEENGPMVAEVIDNTTSRGRTLRFLYDIDHDQFKQELFALGEAPLPRYIIDHKDPATKRYDRPVTPEDIEDYQTVYASKEGAVTAPFTGLHFSRELLKRLEIVGVNQAFITMHCGLSYFSPIEVEDLTKHKMESEEIHVGAEACRLVNETKEAGRKVCCVGSSVLRTCETAVGTDGFLKEYNGWTNKFLFPPYECTLANSMIANFYRPESILMMSVAAFGGYDLVYKAYKTALKNGYLFGCFGDAMLILPD